MGKLNDWIDHKLSGIAKKLPALVLNNPEGFECGYEAGYKRAMLDLEHFMNELRLEPTYSHLYQDQLAHELF